MQPILETSRQNAVTLELHSSHSSPLTPTFLEHFFLFFSIKEGGWVGLDPAWKIPLILFLMKPSLTKGGNSTQCQPLMKT